jgi:hypothetical protein
LSDNAQIWEDFLRQFLDASRDEDMRRLVWGDSPAKSNPLLQVWMMCETLARQKKYDAAAYFKQVYLIGCVRAGLTRLEKNLVGVFDLK